MAWTRGQLPSGSSASFEMQSSEGISQNARNSGVGNYNAQQINNMGSTGAASLVQGGVNSALQRQQAGETSDLSRQNAGQDLLGGHQQGAFSVLNNLLSQGYISEAQRDAALSHYNKLQGGIDQTRQIALGQAKNGLFTDDERSKFDASYNPAMQNALEISDTGGFSPEEWSALMGDFEDLKGRNRAISDRGGLTVDEYGNILTSGRQDMMRAGKNNAESLFNNMAGSASPFAAQALMTKTTADTGANMASLRADLDKYQSDTRMKANSELREALGLQAGTQAKRAETRLGGVNAAKGLTGELSSFLSKDAEGRNSGIDNLLKILGLESDLVGDKASLETKTDPGGKNMDIVDQLMGDLGEIVNVKGNKNGSSKVKTPYGKSSTGSSSSGRGSIGGGVSSGFATGGGFR